MTGPAVRFEVEDADAAFDQIERFGADAATAAQRGMRNEADRAAWSVAAQVPYLTGALAGSVTTDELGGEPVLAMGSGLQYAGWIEYGGSRGRPYIPEGRYLYPTALESTDDLVRAGEAAVDDEIGGYPWH